MSRSIRTFPPSLVRPGTADQQQAPDEAGIAISARRTAGDSEEGPDVNIRHPLRITPMENIAPMISHIPFELIELSPHVDD
ncbi:hypothetical protein K1Y80_22270 [Streptomyces sp. MAG02]|nr:hypothetical protein [Streptomyces sp. MAG02]